MHVLLRSAATAGRQPFLSRSLASLAAGQVLRGAKWNYRLVKSITKSRSTPFETFEATVEPRVGDTNAPRRAIIKVDSSPNSTIQERELYLNHPAEFSSRCFVSAYDTTVGSDGGSIPCLASESMPWTLRRLDYNRMPIAQAHRIIASVIETALTVCTVLARKRLANTNYQSSSVMLSDIQTKHPIVKMGNLANVLAENSNNDMHGFISIAPEVWQGNPYGQPSQVWAPAAMLLHWIKPAMLGLSGSPSPDVIEAWSLAKLMRLFPDWKGPPVNDDRARRRFEDAQTLTTTARKTMFSSWEEEKQGMGLRTEALDLLDRMLVVDPNERPSAAELLASDEFRRLKESVRED